MQKQLYYKDWVRIIHIFFWILLSALLFLIWKGLWQDNRLAIFTTIINLASFLMLVYGHLLYLLPKYFERNKFWSYSIGILLLLIITTSLRFLGWHWVGSLDQTGIVGENKFQPDLFVGMLLGGIFFLVITIPLRLIENWFKKKELETELKTQKLEAELRFLKAQVNPHFLFNALNNIYSLSFTQSQRAPEMILKLSDMMSYMLYDCKAETVPLSSEIEYLKNYIALQQLKKDGEFDIQFIVNTDFEEIMITPMLFIPFFENAFKHGNLENLQKGWMKSTLSSKNQTIQFQCSNSYTIPTNPKQKGGVGLENLRKRLDLLYPDQFEFSTEQTEDTFSIQLQLNLKNHDL